MINLSKIDERFTNKKQGAWQLKLIEAMRKHIFLLQVKPNYFKVFTVIHDQNGSMIHDCWSVFKLAGITLNKYYCVKFPNNGYDARVQLALWLDMPQDNIKKESMS